MPMNTSLAAIIEKAEIDYMLDRMQAIKERDGNPEGIEIRRFHDAIAFYSRTMPWGLFNNVKGTIQEEDVGAIIGFYEERSRPFELQFIPSKANKAVFRLLHDRSFYQAGFHTSMYRELLHEIELSNNKQLLVRELHEDEFELYAQIHCLGTGLSLDGQSSVASNNRVLHGREGWRYYIGFYNEEPAAVAVMHMKDQVASLTFAATLPAYRQLGLHTELLLYRMKEALRHGCKLIVGQCAYCSGSHRNMERAGMKLAYTRSTWTQV